MWEQNPRLTRGSSPVSPRFLRGFSAVYKRDEKRSFFLAADQWTIAFFVLVNPFHARNANPFHARYVRENGRSGGAEIPQPNHSKNEMPKTLLVGPLTVISMTLLIVV